MKKTTKNRLTVTCALAAMICGVAGVMAINNFIGAEEDFYGNYALKAFTAYAEEAPEEGETTSVIGTTKYNVSQEKDYLLVATTLTDASTVYEVGYDFGGSYTVKENDRAETKKYYTSIKAGDNTYTAANIFGESYTAETPMIVWEVAYDPAKEYTFHAYAKTGTPAENGNLQITDPETVVHGRDIIIPTVVTVTPNVNQGVLSWNGTANEYNIYNGEALIGTVPGNTTVSDNTFDFDLAAALKCVPGSYTIKVEAVGATEPVVYQDVAFEIVGLTNENFVSTLNSASADKYYVLTENVTLAYRKDATGDYGNEGEIMPTYSIATWNNGGVAGTENIYSPISTFFGVLDGCGYKVSVSYIGGNDKVGGLFGAVQNARIKNLNFSAEWGVWGNLAESGVLTYVIGSDVVIENCYIQSTVSASDGDVQSNVGGIAGRTFYLSGMAPIVRNCVIDSEVVHFSTKVHLGQKACMVKNVAHSIVLENNAYIVNAEVASTDIADGGNYYSCFYSDSTSVTNMLYATLSDFTNGVCGNKCEYASWSFTWTSNVGGKVYESEAWANTTFAYDTVNGRLTLCGKSIQTTV